MSCAWAGKVGLFVDDELPPAAHEQVAAHLGGCAECTAAVAEQMALRKVTRVAANRYTAPPELHAALYRQMHPPARVSRWWNWRIAVASFVLVFALGLLLRPRLPGKDPLLTELVDQHVIALSSPNPVDVISEDRHTVKPWFQGKLPFSFNLPELAGSNFTLIGGKVVYLQQNPAAELLYQTGRHKISVFVLQEGSGLTMPVTRSSFNIKNWNENGLQFYLVTDGSDAEAARLVTMLREANRP
jgi:anti-sigma factor RsiW